VFAYDAFDQALALQVIETVRDLILIRREQRPAALERDADLDAGECSAPAEHDPAHRAGDTAVLADEDGNRSGAPVRRTADGLTWEVFNYLPFHNLKCSPTSSSTAAYSWPCSLSACFFLTASKNSATVPKKQPVCMRMP